MQTQASWNLKMARAGLCKEVNVKGHVRLLTCPHRLALQHHTVEDETDVFGGGGGTWPLFPQHVEDLSGQYGVLAILDKLTQVGQACFLALWVFLYDTDDTIHNGSLVIKATLQRETN